MMECELCKQEGFSEQPGQRMDPDNEENFSWKTTNQALWLTYKKKPHGFSYIENSLRP